MADASNYHLTNTTDTTAANITARPITVTPASNQSKIVGAADPVLTYTITVGSLVTGESFTGALTRDPGETVGPYPIRVGTLTAGTNYALTFTPGVLFNIYYGWTGFLQPINDTAHTGLYESKFKLGQTIPAKFVLKNAQGVVVQQVGNPTFTRSGNNGACDATAVPDTITDTVTPDPNAVYTWDGSQYHYNWSTKGLSAGEYRIYANLADGTKNFVDICLN